MAEILPAYRCQLYASHTEGADLGGGSSNTWTGSDSGRAEELAHIRYSFTASSGYTQRQEDWSVEGQAIRFDYDLSQSPYAKKRQFVLGAYAYLLEKKFSFGGSLPLGQPRCYLSGSSGPGRKKFQRDLDSYSFAHPDRYLDDLQENSYIPVNRLYLYPQPGITKNSLLQDASYSASAELRFSGQSGSHPPYLDIVAEDVVPSVTGAQPADCFADKTEDITLRWQLSYEELRYADFVGYESSISTPGRVYGTLNQKTVRVRWTEDNVTIHEETLETADGSYLIPAGSITGDSFRWQVEVCTDDGIWSTAEDWYEVRCDNDTLSTAAALQPQKRIIDGGSDNLFRWEHHNASGSRPTAADLQYSVDKAQWQELLHVDSRDCSATVPANSLPAGPIWWRVRTYNASGVAGAWSEPVQVTVRSAPPAPILLSVTTTPFPEIFWSAEGQLVAEVKLDDEVQRLYGDAVSCRWKSLVPAGSHSVALRIQNRYGLWSPWTEQSLSVLNYPQSGLVLSGEVGEDSVRVTWTRSFPKALLYRDGEVLAQLGEGTLSYEDDSALGSHRYLLRGISGEGYYSDSNELAVTLTLRGAILAVEGDSSRKIGFTGRFGKAVGHVCTVERGLHYRSFVGKEQPLAFVENQRQKRHSFTFSLGKEELDKLELLCSFSGEAVSYRDARGSNIRGILEQVQSTHHGLYVDVDFVIVEAERRGA